MQNNELLDADSRYLSEPMSVMLEKQGFQATFTWLTELLERQRPALKSGNSKLVAYTGSPEGINWLESNVSSPVTSHWGESAALLGVSWAKIKEWLASEKNHKIMALDALYAYRLPAPNMAPFAQIAAPVLEDAPSTQELETTLNKAMEDGGNPRMRQTVEAILGRSSEILSPRTRGVEVEDLPRLFLNPEAFEHSSEIIESNEEVVTGIRSSINKMMAKFGLNLPPNK